MWTYNKQNQSIIITIMAKMIFIHVMMWMCNSEIIMDLKTTLGLILNASILKMMMMEMIAVESWNIHFIKEMTTALAMMSLVSLYKYRF